MSRSFVNKALLAWCLVLVPLLLAACEAAEPVANKPSGTKKVATFEGGEITEAEVQERLDLVAQQSGAGEISPDSPQYDAALAQVMPQLVTEEIARAYAREHGITVSEEDVNKEIEKIKEQLANEARAQGQDVKPDEAFKQALEQAGLTEAELRQQIREQLPVQRVQERVVGDAEPTDREVKEYYEQNKDAQFKTPAQRCVQHILLNPDQQEKAEEVRQQLEEGAKFAELAKEFSQDPGSKENGGELGCIGKGETVPNFEEAVFNAEEGNLLGPVETQFGYHIIKVNEVRPEETTPLEEVEPQIREQLAFDKQSQEFQKWVEEQEKKRNVKYLPGYDPTPEEEKKPKG